MNLMLFYKLKHQSVCPDVLNVIMAQTVVQNAHKVKTVVTENVHNAKIRPSARRVNKTSNLIKS